MVTLSTDPNPNPSPHPYPSPGSLKAFVTLLNYRMCTHYKSGEFLGPRIGDKIFSGVLILSLYWGIGDEKVA